MAEVTVQSRIYSAVEGDLLAPIQGASPQQAQRLVYLLLVIADTLTITLGLVLAYVVRFPLNPGLFYVPPTSSLEHYMGLVLALAPLWILLFACYRLYDMEMLFSGTTEYGRIISACTMGVVVVIGLSFFAQDTILIISRGWLLISWITVAGCVGLERFAIRRVIYAVWAHGQLQRRAIIVGTTTEAHMVAEQVTGRSSRLRIIGFVATPEGEAQPDATRVIGNLDDLRDLITEYRVDEVILVPSALTHPEILRIVRTFAVHPVTIRLSPGLYEVMTTGVRVGNVNGVPLVTVNRLRIVGIDAFLKRGLDCIGATLGLVCLAPFFLLTALAVWIDSPGGVFYRRPVIGGGGKRFGAWKFRTMVPNADQVLKANPALYEVWCREGKLRDDPRITRMGRLLRRTSIDELPQLLNVLRGEMSLVGPRMITPDELTHFGTWRHNLLTVKPGITGLWQVRGRSTLSYEERVTLDMDYIRNYSIWLDVRLLAQTIPAIVRGRGAY